MKINQRPFFSNTHWKAYSAAAAAFLLGKTEAQAEVVFNNLDPDLFVAPGDTLDLDIDGDGVDDLRFWIESETGVVTSAGGAVFDFTYRFAYASGLGNNVLFGVESSNDGYVFNAPTLFYSGQAIEDTLPNFLDRARLSGVVLLDGIPFYEGGAWSGVNGMMGMRFKIGDASHFAWLRVDVQTNGSGITIESYAWDNQADAGMVAGITTPIESNAANKDISIWSFGDNIFLDTRGAAWQIDVFHTSGQQVWSGTAQGSPWLLKLPEPAGVYLVQARKEDQWVTQSVYLSRQ